LKCAGRLDRTTFETFLETVLVPRPQPGEVMVPENLSVHRSAWARVPIEAAGSQLHFL
jgi:hypothetical protein